MIDTLTPFDSVADFFGEYAMHGATKIPGFFRNDHAPLSFSGQDVTSVKPAFSCRTALAAGLTEGETLVITSPPWGISSVSYSILYQEQNPPDDGGPGFTRLVLKKI